MKNLKKIGLGILIISSFVLSSSTASAFAAVSIKGSITICKVVLDTEGNVVPGTEGSFEVPSTNLGNTTFTAPLNLNTNLLLDVPGQDAQCISYNNLPIQLFGNTTFNYGQENITSNGFWEAPVYNEYLIGSPHFLKSNINNQFHAFNQNEDNADGTITLSALVRNRTLVVVNKMKPIPTGSIEITKYVCPANTTVVRSVNGVGGTVPTGCVPQEGKTFGYVHGTQSNANAPYPELGATLTAAGATNSSGLLNISPLQATGRYLVVETNNDNQKIPDGDILGFYCVGDGDTSDNNDNQELTFVPVDATVKCVAYNKAPPTSIVIMCKQSDTEQHLSGWTLMLKGESVEDLSVNSNSSLGATTSNPLVAGASYVAKAVGTWLNQSGANPVDAEYSTTDGWLTHMDGYTGYQADILELQIDNNFDPSSDWGTYNSLHTYAQSFIPNTTSASFRMFDGVGAVANPDWYGDNSDSVEVNISKGYSGITGENGCVTFTDVPYGEYSVDEIAQDEWTNVSGLGIVSVNQAEELFTVVNHQTVDLCPNISGAQENISKGMHKDESGNCVDDENQCNDTSADYYSDTTDMVEGHPAFAPLTFIHSAWTAAIEGATWIWDGDGVSDPVNETIKTFTKEFSIDGAPQTSSIVIASDNSYTVKINGDTVCTDETEGNSGGGSFANPATCEIASSLLISGNNMLSITVKSFATEDGTLESNPAGLKYKLHIASQKCEEPKGSIEIKKYDCPDGVSVVRSLNGLGEGKSVPESCTPNTGAHFSYVHGTQTDTGPDYPELSAPLISAGSSVDGTLTIANLPATGRYLIVETNSDNVKLESSQVLGLYCEGDGDTSDSNDNQELTFVPAGGVAHCIAYDKLIVSQPVDVCRNVDGLQTEGPCADQVCLDQHGEWDGEAQRCILPPVDVCPNIEGLQTEVPQGKRLVDGQCVNAGRGGGGIIGGGQVLGASTTGQVLGASTSCGIYLSDYIKKGSKNNKDAVKKLQEFLNDYLKLAPPIPVNGIFGPQTFKAVIKFQEQESDYVLKPWGGKKGTGYVYKTTTTRINNLKCPDLKLPIPEVN